jgi:hypothetical protein
MHSLVTFETLLCSCCCIAIKLWLPSNWCRDPETMLPVTISLMFFTHSLLNSYGESSLHANRIKAKANKEMFPLCLNAWILSLVHYAPLEYLVLNGGYCPSLRFCLFVSWKEVSCFCRIGTKSVRGSAYIWNQNHPYSR